VRYEINLNCVRLIFYLKGLGIHDGPQTMNDVTLFISDTNKYTSDIYKYNLITLLHVSISHHLTGGRHKYLKHTNIL
jgi:hypothetical protein